MLSLQELLFNKSELKPKADIIKTLKSCARKGVTMDPSSDKQIYYLDKIDFYTQELKSLRDSMKNGVMVCERKRPKGSGTIYENLFLYFSSRTEKSK